ncbi:MAG: hypothetical protein J0H74_30075 [Chitinophagaceae bacterium]|nr:hypothetical protein [Chitinophagaceae bacterium]
MNDSLGKISIIVGVRDSASPGESLIVFGRYADNELRKKGYSLKSNRQEISKAGTNYLFTEYFMKDSANKDVKLYNLFGHTPSSHHFVEFGLFHDGPRDDLAKIIFNLIVTSVYIENERFFNPYLN